MDVNLNYSNKLFSASVAWKRYKEIVSKSHKCKDYWAIEKHLVK